MKAKIILVSLVLLNAGVAYAQSTSVMGHGSDGYPQPIKATGNRLHTATTLVSPDGGTIGTLRVDPTGETSQPISAQAPDGGSKRVQSTAAGAVMAEIANEGQSPGHVQPRMVSPDGGYTTARSTAGGVAKVTHDAMCFSDSCIEITATQVSDGGTATVVAGQWYEVTVTSDGAGGIAGCWVNGSIVTTCTAKPRLKDGQKTPIAFAASGADAGAGAGNAIVYFMATSATTMTAVLCPETPCQ